MSAASAMSITPLGVTPAGVTVLLSSPGVLAQTVPTAFQAISSTAAVYGSNAAVALSNAALLRAGGEMSGALTLSDAPLQLTATSGVGATVVHVTSNAAATAWITADGRAAFMGALGVGASNPLAPLHVSGANGDGVSIVSQYDVASTSDARDKTDLRRIDGALGRVRRVAGYTYARRDDPSSAGTRYAGLLAQEVREVLPEVVHEGGDGRLTLAYGNVVALLVEAIKDLGAEVDELRRAVRAAPKVSPGP